MSQYNDWIYRIEYARASKAHPHYLLQSIANDLECIDRCPVLDAVLALLNQAAPAGRPVVDCHAAQAVEILEEARPAVMTITWPGGAAYCVEWYFDGRTARWYSDDIHACRERARHPAPTDPADWIAMWSGYQPDAATQTGMYDRF